MEEIVIYLKIYKMKTFLSYKYTWEDIEELNIVLSSIKEKLEQKWLRTFCSLWLDDYFEEQKMTVDQIYKYCLDELKKTDMFLAFIKSEEESKWMKMELEEAKNLGKRIILIIKKWLRYNNFRNAANKTIEFTTLEELYETLLWDDEMI